MFDTKIAIVLLNSLQIWQKLNVTSFLTSGIIGDNPSLIGKEYKDNSNYNYLPLNKQPVIILEADENNLKKIHSRIINKSLRCSIYINDMFLSGHDEANRKTVEKYKNIVIQKCSEYDFRLLSFCASFFFSSPLLG